MHMHASPAPLPILEQDTFLATFEGVEPVISTFSDKITHLGPAGSGHLVKAVNNALLAASASRRPLRNLWRRIRRKSTEEPSEPEPEQPALKVGESVVVEATGRSGKVSLVAANGWCQVTYDDEECEGQTETLQCPDLVREEAALAETIDAEVSDFDEILIKWGFKEDPRIPEECRVDQMTRIKDSGQAGVIAYAITEAGFWVGSVPFALGAAYVATGEIPDWTTEEGKTALGGYAFVLINFARLIVPARIALALAFAPWVDENIVKRFNPPDPSDLPEDCVIEESEEE